MKFVATLHTAHPGTTGAHEHPSKPRAEAHLVVGAGSDHLTVAPDRTLIFRNVASHTMPTHVALWRGPNLVRAVSIDVDRATPWPRSRHEVVEELRVTFLIGVNPGEEVVR